jgi:Ser/Thr protein kinase RdoA (MazF antagonist)
MMDLLDIANQFNFPSSVERVEPHGSGIINDTYIVTFSNPPVSEHPRLGKRAILQRINSTVFPQPELIMHNLESVLQHVAQKMGQQASDSSFLLPPIYKTKQGASSFRDDELNYWRAIGFIERTVTFDILQDINQAREVGAALGAFHQILSDIPVQKLHDTLPGFHHTPGYLQQYESVKAQWQSSTSAEDAADINYCVPQIDSRRALAGLLMEQEPAISVRVMHGDPKLNNILFDESSGKAVSIIDLDTIKPGLIHFDLGDCFRSCCNSGGEMPEQMTDVKFDVSVFQAILEGYISNAVDLLSDRDFDLLYDTVRLLPFELGLRFFTDYLQGNQYFKVNSPGDNLYRAKVQFHLLQSIEDQEEDVRQVIGQVKSWK